MHGVTVKILISLVSTALDSVLRVRKEFQSASSFDRIFHVVSICVDSPADNAITPAGARMSSNSIPHSSALSRNSDKLVSCLGSSHAFPVHFPNAGYLSE
jgi:hypothetical protein